MARVFVYANSKGGSGKTTAALVAATELALQTKVGVVDADARSRIARWAARSTVCPENLSVYGGSGEDNEVNETNILEKIDEAASVAPIVIVDLEGAATTVSLLAISQADLVVIPLQDSEMDAFEAGAVIKVIRQQERLTKRSIPFCILPTRTPSAYRSKGMSFILEQLAPSGARVLKAELKERQAFKGMFMYFSPLEELPRGEVAGVEAAIENAREYVRELLQVLKESSAKNEESAA